MQEREIDLMITMGTSAEDPEAYIYSGAASVDAFAAEHDMQVVRQYVTDEFEDTDEAYQNYFAQMKAAHEKLAKQGVDLYILTTSYLELADFYEVLYPFIETGIPVFSINSTEDVRCGALAAVEMFDYQNIGRFAADVLRKYHDGADLGQLPQQYATAPFLVLNIDTMRKTGVKLSKNADAFVGLMRSNVEPEQFVYERTKIRTQDEIRVLADSFVEMAEGVKHYMMNLRTVTAEKQRIGTELELATRIQANMLPNIFPAFPDREDFDIYASMTPAKEVGGDFYDFFLIDEDHLAIVMADVSGKGVPAALFMMMSKILINNVTMMAGAAVSPAEVLKIVNDIICQNNEEEMFVTVWLGIMTMSTGHVLAANAGHEYPILKKANGQFELFRDKHGFVIGGMAGMHYKEYEFTIEKEGALFLYTDGVAEATNADDELFGIERTLCALNHNEKTAQITPKDMLCCVKEAVDQFVGEAPQFGGLGIFMTKKTMDDVTYEYKDGKNILRMKKTL